MFSHFLRKVLPFGWRVTTARPRALRRGRWRWHLTPAGDAAFGSSGPDLEEWVATGTAVVVKTALQRTVYRVTLPDGTTFVKHCRINGIRAWCREVLRPAKARLEFENALALQERGIPAVVPLAWGEPASGLPGDSVLITRGLDGVPFVRFADEVLPTLPPTDRARVRRQLAVGLGLFLAKLHDAGVSHPDPHAGNFVVEWTPAGVPHFALLDLHAVRLVNRPLAGNEVITNLVLYNRWFQLRATRTDRFRFWHSYHLSRSHVPDLRVDGRGMVRRLEDGTLASNRRFWAGRETRCLGTNRYFRRVKRGAFRGFAVRDMTDDVVRDVLADPDALFRRPEVALYKDSRTSTVAELTIITADGTRAAVLKRFNIRRPSEVVKNLFRRSPAARSWVNGHALLDRLLPTPRPLLMFHRYRYGLPAEGYLLTEKVPDAVELPEAVRQPNVTPAALRGVIHRLARMLRTLHDRGVSHRDLKAANILLERAADPVLVDLVGVRTGVRLTTPQRAKELARLSASFLSSPAVTNGDRVRFLLSYLAAGPAIGAGWKNWWHLVSRATAAKVARNRRTGRPLA